MLVSGRKLLFTLLVNCFFSLEVFAVDLLYHSGEEAIQNADKLKSTIIQVGVTGASHKFNHNETSASAGFFSLNQTSNIEEYMGEIGIGKELFAQSRLSLTVIALGSMSFGSDTYDNESTHLSYQDEISGYGYGGLASINLNFFKYGLKWQPFIAAKYMMKSSDFELSYTQTTPASGAVAESKNTVNINYEADNTVMEYSLGLRFIDNLSGMMSYFIMSYNTYLSESIASSASGTSGTYTLENNDTGTINAPEYGEFSASMGIGIMF